MISIIFGFLAADNVSRAHAEASGEDIAEIISAEHFVTFYEAGQKMTIKTDAATVGEALSRAKIKLAETDLVDPAREEKINANNYHVNIYRSRPVLVVDNMIKKYLMSASYDKKTIVKEAGLSVYDGDEISLESGADTLAEAGLVDTYRIKRRGGSTITVEEDLPYSEKTEPDSSLTAGQQKNKQAGELGKKSTTYQIKFKDGKEAERIKMSETVIKKPVDRITVIGAKIGEFTANPDKATCESWIRAAGVPESDVASAYWIIQKESNCRYNATNKSSGAYGIPQSLPGTKMASAGSDWQTNPVTQIKWMSKYVNRYGGWAGAVEFWKKHQTTSYTDAAAALQKTHAEALLLIETFSNDELFAKNAFAWTDTTTLGSYCISATSSHYGWAIQDIKKAVKRYRNT